MCPGCMLCPQGATASPWLSGHPRAFPFKRVGPRQLARPAAPGNHGVCEPLGSTTGNAGRCAHDPACMWAQGVDLIWESVGGDMFRTCTRALAQGGRLVVIGMMSQYSDGWAASEARLTQPHGPHDACMLSREPACLPLRAPPPRVTSASWTHGMVFVRGCRAGHWRLSAHGCCGRHLQATTRKRECWRHRLRTVPCMAPGGAGAAGAAAVAERDGVGLLPAAPRRAVPEAPGPPRRRMAGRQAARRARLAAVQARSPHLCPSGQPLGSTLFRPCRRGCAPLSSDL